MNKQTAFLGSRPHFTISTFRETANFSPGKLKSKLLNHRRILKDKFQTSMSLGFIVNVWNILLFLCEVGINFYQSSGDVEMQNFC